MHQLLRRRERGAAPRTLLAVGLALVIPLAGCDTLGTSCESNSDCDDDQVCGQPACDSSREAVCFYPCGSDAECADLAGDGSTCFQFDGCIGYCTPAQ